MEKVSIIGAGLVGSLQAIILAQKGYEVSVFERREDMRKQKMAAGRSINLALSNRGWKALELADMKKNIEEIVIPMYGRTMHDVEGNTSFQPYGKKDEAIFSVSRGDLNKRLMDKAESYENVHFYFSHECKNIDLDKKIVYFYDHLNNTEKEIKVDRLFGTDGAFSAVRSRMQLNERFNYEQMFLQHGYKELYIPATSTGGYKIDKNSLHIWPRGEFMLIALPNEDGSFTCTLFFPFEGKPSFESVQTESDLLQFFQTTFPDVLELMPNLSALYFENPTSSLVTIKCSPWNYEDWILLLGDASHAIVPFYGQGMNAGFEDCTLFNETFENQNRNFGEAFKAFSKQRKEDADAISDLALYNFIEMRDRVADELFLLRKKIEKKIFEKYPDKWMPLYSQVTFSHLPYSHALKTGKKQDKIMDRIMEMENIEQIWDQAIVENEILKQIQDA